MEPAPNTPYVWSPPQPHSVEEQTMTAQEQAETNEHMERLFGVDWHTMSAGDILLPKNFVGRK